MTEPSGVAERRKPLRRMRDSIRVGVKSLLAATDRKAGVSVIHVYFSSMSCLMRLNGLCLKKNVPKMLERKEYFAEDTVSTIKKAYTGF